MKTILTKLCLVCGKEFAKPYYTGIPEWNNRRFCSRICSDLFKRGKPTWNKGKKTGIIPYTAFEVGDRPSPKTEFKKGHIPWNKKTWLCQVCGKQMPRKGKKYCSVKCKSTVLRKPRLIKDCSICGSVITRKYSEDNKRWSERKYCSKKCQFDGQGVHFRGEKNVNWKGGVTPLRNAIRGLREYRLWYRTIFERDNWTCQICFARSGNGKKIILNADHYPKAFSTILKENNVESISDALKCRELWNLDNGRTLCISCHKKETAKLRKIL